MANLLERMVLHPRIELGTSPLPKHCITVQALTSLAFIP
jgi:hypothetical protein